MANKNSFELGSVRIEIEDAPMLRFPGDTDCNSPCWWRGGQFYMLNSTGHPTLSSGDNVTSMIRGEKITYTSWRDGGRWIESVHQAEDGTLYGWYHNEPQHLIPAKYQEGHKYGVTAPFIGAVVSYDNGNNWDDLGLVLTSPPDALSLEKPNFFFAGGNGDFSVILDRRGEYFYFLIGTYHIDPAQQGVSLARMAAADLACPVGKVFKWHAGSWQQPGLGGSVTPILPVAADWYSPTPDTFWGPSVHWNETVRRYVILLNRAVDPNWKQGGIYLSLSPDLSDPGSWTPPLRILDEAGWYPQVVGSDFSKEETEREAGSEARLFIHGESKYILRFFLRG